MRNDLRVLHFSTGHLGGAGLAARRLNQSLITRGVDSTFYAFEHESFNPLRRESSLLRSTLTKVLSKAVTSFNLKIGEKVFFSLFNLNALNGDFFVPYKNKNTILHFHNFYNLIDPQTILALSNRGYNVVVTLHDQRMFTGGCHYAFDCKGFESDCFSCPQVSKLLRPLVSRNMRYTRKLAHHDAKLFFIAPSMWMKDQVIKSQVVSPDRVRFIPNSLGTEFPSSNQQQKNPNSTAPFKLGIASMDLNSYIKGSDLVHNLAREAADNNLPLEFVRMKDFEGELDARDFWNSIDCLLVLSRADNSPNVIHEAKSFGVPVVGNKLGGIAELLDPDFDFLVANSEVRAYEIQRYLEDLFFSADFNERLLNMKDRFNEYVSHSIEGHLDYYEFMIQGSE